MKALAVSKSSYQVIFKSQKAKKKKRVKRLEFLRMLFRTQETSITSNIKLFVSDRFLKTQTFNFF